MTDSHPEPLKRPMSRRSFNAALATAGAGFTVAANAAAQSSSALAGEGRETTAKAPVAKPEPPSKPDTPAKPDAPAKAEASPKPADPGPLADADLALQLLLARFPDKRLRDPEVQESLRSDLERHRLRSLLLATVPLANGDEPGFQFGAYRRGGLS